jgi:hypothetical protein
MVCDLILNIILTDAHATMISALTMNLGGGRHESLIGRDWPARFRCI